MKKSARQLLLLATLWLSGYFSLFSQNVVISGPNQLCFGECGTYLLVSLDSSIIASAQWSINGTPTFNTTGPITLCANAPFGMAITVVGFTTNQTTFVTETFVEVVTGLNPIIISTTAACPDSSATACERVCANTSATYEVSGVPTGAPVEWEVIGAESFSASGNQVTVNWGAPGQGKVTAEVSGSAGPPLQLFCGQNTFQQSPDGTVSGSALGYWYGGTPPYSVTVFDVWGNVVSSGTPAGNSFPSSSLPPGLYYYIVEDAAGNSETCNFVIVSSGQDCWFSIFPTTLSNPTSGTNCNGFISVSASSGGGTYSYIWSNGATGSQLSNLCCGTYSVTVTNSQGCTKTASITLACPSVCSGSSSLCVEILEQPEAIIGAAPPVVNGTIEICQGQTVFFQNQSLDASSYVWDFGDLNTSTQFNPSHTYNTPGAYTVSLIARNECYCSDTTFVTVNVLAADVPEISCTGTVCEGETVTYSTTGGCSNYNWSISGGGTILSGGGPGDSFITIQWHTGPQGSVSLDVSGCPGSVCNLPNVIPIPILSDNVQIQGPDKVCEGSTEEYFIPDFAGTEITWTVLGSGNITDGQGTERIAVKWYGNANVGNPQRVIVEFENCYLGCTGRDTLEVFIVPGFYVEGPIEVCQSTTATYRSRNTITGNLMNCNWQVFNAAGFSVWASAVATNTANIPFNLPPGSYTVRATAASATGFCNNTYDVFVKLVAAPPPVTALGGATEICPGTPYRYEAQGLPASQFAWTVTGGTPATFSGNPVNVTWGATPPYLLSAVQIATTGLACASSPVALAVNPLPDFSISGDGQICRETTGSYSVPFFENIDYQWVVSPSGAGTIVSGQGSASVNVLWHKAGPASLSVAGCSFNKNFNLTVLPLPEPVVLDAEVCFGETANLTTTAPFVSYVWKNESGVQISTLPSANFGGGFYEVEVTDANGCKSNTTFEVVEHPMPVVSISAPIYLGLCPNGPPATIHATTSEGGYDYAWFQNNTPVGTNADTFATNIPGTYKVVVTDQFGCTGDSKLLLLEDCESVGGDCFGGVCGNGVCNGLPGDPCVDGGNITFSINPTADCSTHQYQNTSVNFVPGTFTWNFGDPLSGAANTSTLENPQHTFSKPGFYSILLLGGVPNLLNPNDMCPDGQLSQDTILAVANFENRTACPGSPMEFFDRSEYMAFATLTAWAWDFGDPASGAANTSNLQKPTHIYADTGTYTVTLTITEASGCQSTVSKNITVQAPPTVDFSLPAITCENTAIPFSANVSGDVTSFTWDFGDPAGGAANTSSLANPFHEYGLPGVYIVTVTATSVYGCTATFNDDVTVEPNTLGGTIAYSQPSPICEGESITLTSPSGGIVWNWTTGTSADNVTIMESGIYDVTLTDGKGCSYSPPAAPVDVFGEPNGIIKGVEYNGFGQPVAFFENNQTICEGEEVTLIVQGSLTYSYVWSNGLPGDEISFTEDKNNLLPVGTHHFTVTVTDNTTSCTSVEGPFTVQVNPRPNVQIASVPSGFLCENNSATLNVTSPQGGLTYSWNTGETGTSITVIAGGTYFTQAVNQFGCRGRSNEIVVNNAPDIDLIPNGCHQRCDPDTVCLPFIATAAGYQWFFNGNPIAGPGGNLPNPIFTQSGDYFVELTDVFGCTSVSDVLSLTISPDFGTGDILGNVYLDVNGNGFIDAGDTPVSGIGIFLGNGAVHLDTVTSGMDGGYLFEDLLANGYALVLDTANLPANWTAYLDSTFLNLSGCSSELTFNWLLAGGCVTVTNTLNFEACEGDGVTFDGIFISAGDSQDFTYLTTQGCDSILTVSVAALPVSSSQLGLSACPGSTVTYSGQPLSPGMVQDFIFQNQNGCDSVVSVTVTAFPHTVLFIDGVACEGEFLEFNGVQIPAGSQQVFTQMNVDGCLDSTIVGVFVLPTSSSSLNLAACGNSAVTYGGQQLFPGDVQDFVFQNQYGCDSVVTVTVQAAQVDTVALPLQVCAGETVDYAGQVLSAGDQINLVFTNQAGCDSVVTVSVTSYPSATFDLTADLICWNSDDGIIEVQHLGGGLPPYLFSLDGTTWKPDTVFGGLTPGSYTVFLQDGSDCIVEKEIEISSVPPVLLETNDETLVCGDSVLLSPIAISQLPLTWEWPGGSALPEFWVKLPGTYTVKVKNDCETVERHIQVGMEPVVPDRLIYMPNSFSPNGDGINDCYQGYLSPRVDLQRFTLKIFDRWGNMLFESNDPNECWDGYFKGKPMDPAVFAWFIEMEVLYCDGRLVSLFEEGGIHLIR
mgnify:FL=1